MTRPFMLFVLAGSLSVAGCASNPPQASQSYSKAGATQQEFMKDRSECIQKAQREVAGAYGAVSSGTTFIKCDAVGACLATRGYMADAKGNLVAPPGTDVACVN